MKFLVEARKPTDVGNRKLKDGSMMKQAQAYLAEVRPDAVYFSVAEGQRTIFMIVNLAGPEKIPEIAEPLWLDWEAEVYFTPVMDAKEFEKAGPGIQKVVKSRM